MSYSFSDFLDILLITFLPPTACEDTSKPVESLQIRDTESKTKSPISQVYNLFEKAGKKQYWEGRVIQMAKINKNSFFFFGEIK